MELCKKENVEPVVNETQGSCVWGGAHYFLTDDTLLNFHLMTQPWALIVDSGELPGDPLLGEGGRREAHEVGRNHSL